MGSYTAARKSLKKSYKFFCRGLDIRVPEIVKAEVGQSGAFQDMFKPGCNFIRRQLYAFSGEGYD